jgi:hypothetical protein
MARSTRNPSSAFRAPQQAASVHVDPRFSENPNRISVGTKEIASMTINTRLALLAAGAVAMAAALTMGSQALAQAGAAPITDISAQQDKKKKVAPKAVAPRPGAPRAVAPKTMAPKVGGPTVVRPKVGGPTVVRPKVGGPKVGGPPVGAPKVGGPKVGGPPVGAPKIGGAKVGTPAAVAPKVAAPKGTPRVFTPKGAAAGTVTAAKLRGVPGRGAGRAFVRGQNYAAWRSGHRVRHGGRWKTFVALSALGAILVGTNYYYPYAYITAPQPFCEGLTEDGCRLVWEEVETSDGDLIDQCVAYCPWQ